jgi:hypothetical protein
MPSGQITSVEFFGERGSVDHSMHFGEVLRFGCRLSGTDTVLTFTEVPLSVVLAAVRRQVTARLTPDGMIVASLDFDSCRPSQDVEVTPVLQLVEALVEPAALLLEETKTSDLTTLLQILQQAIRMIEAAQSGVEVQAKPVPAARRNSLPR